MGVDEEIRHRLERSLLVVDPPSPAVDQVIRRGSSLRRRRRARGSALAVIALVAVAAPLVLLSPLGAHRPGPQITPQTELSLQVATAQGPSGRGIPDV